MPFDDLMGRVRVAARAALDDLAREVWQSYEKGLVTDDEASAIIEKIERRRHPEPRAPAKPKRCRVRSLARRRRRAAAGPLPPSLAHHFTTGELAVLHVIAGEIVREGRCTLTVGQIAAEAGVGLTTVRQARRTAVEAGLMSCLSERLTYCRSKPNELRIIDPAWTLWLRKGRHRFSDAHVQDNIIPEERAGIVWHASEADGQAGARHRPGGEGVADLGSGPTRLGAARPPKWRQELVPQTREGQVGPWANDGRYGRRSQNPSLVDLVRAGRRT